MEGKEGKKLGIGKAKGIGNGGEGMEGTIGRGGKGRDESEDK